VSLWSPMQLRGKVETTSKSWERPVAPGKVLGASWSVFGTSRERLGSVLERLVTS
jgi:hypothetical protein